MNWLTIELTSRCQKSCPFCGRAKARERGELILGDMDLEFLNSIVNQYRGEIIQFSKDGEPLLYDNIWAVGQICSGFTTGIVTNGILLWDKADAIIENFTTVTVSVYEDDAEQFENVKRFVEKKGLKNPMVYIKFLGDYRNPEYEKLGLKTTNRSIHNPKGDTGYRQNGPVIPEIGVCLDFLYKPSISWDGKFHICNRYDPEGLGVIGNCYVDSLYNIWDSELRMELLSFHKKGMRDAISICRTCEYWGYPASV